MTDVRVTGLYTYPIKGCRRLEHDGARVEPWGLAGDRRWLVTEPDGAGLTQREVPELVRVRPRPRAGGGLVLSAPGMPDLAVAEPVGAELTEVSVGRHPIAASPAGPAADDWLTAVLDRKARLVWLDDPTRRPVDPDHGRAEDRVSFADGYPVLLAR